MVEEFEERIGIAMSWTSVQGVEMGGGSGTVCWHRTGESGTGSSSVRGQDGCDDTVERTENGGSQAQSPRMTFQLIASSLKQQHDVSASI